MNLSQQIAEYIENGRSRGLSCRWMELRGQELEQWRKWLKEEAEIEQSINVNEKHLRQYLIYLQKENESGNRLSAITVSHRFNSVKRLFEWMRARGYILENPGNRIKAPKYKVKIPRVLNESEVKKLIELPDTGSVLGMRNRALMELLYGTGIRHKECWSLNIWDVDVRGCMLRINQGKGSKDRIVPMTRKALYWTEKYICQARRELAVRVKKNSKLLSSSAALWVSRDGYRLSYGRLDSIIKGYGDELKLEVNMHMFRHCYATHLLSNGADIRYIQRLLGHSDIQSTMIYTHLKIEDLHEIVAKLGR